MVWRHSYGIRLHQICYSFIIFVSMTFKKKYSTWPWHDLEMMFKRKGDSKEYFWILVIYYTYVFRWSSLRQRVWAKYHVNPSTRSEIKVLLVVFVVDHPVSRSRSTMGFNGKIQAPHMLLTFFPHIEAKYAQGRPGL